MRTTFTFSSARWSVVARVSMLITTLSCSGGDSTGPEPGQQVQPPAVASVTVTVPSPEIQVGASVTVTTTLKDASGNVLIGRTIAWSSDKPDIARVSDQGIVTGINAGGPVTITAFSEGKSGSTQITVVAVGSVTVTPPTASIVVGSSTQLTASVLSSSGAPLSDRTISWTSSNSAIASVSQTGMVSAVAVGGPVTITATCEGKSASASITVTPVPPAPVASVVVSPPSATIIIGSTTQLTASTLDNNGNVLEGRSITWSSSNSSIASVSGTGLVTAVAVGGPVTITATSEGKSGSATVTVTAVPVGIVMVNPPSASIIVGSSVQLNATTFDSIGVELFGRTVTWSSSNTNVATVSASGLVVGVTPGAPVTITATSEGRAGTAVITVLPVPIASITITPSAPSIIAGTGVQLTATAFDASGNALTGRSFSWLSSNSAVASVNSSGLVTGVAPGGPVTISATSEGVIGTASVTVTPVPFNGIRTGIHDVVQFLNQCPTTDPAYNTIRQDFTFLRDGLPDNVAITCAEPYSAMPIAQLTDELIAIQTLRFVYYMSQGTEGKLPWTNLSLYDWMKAQVAGINFHSQPGLSACCDVIGGKLYIITSQQTASAREFYRDWPGLSGKLALFVHEARHVAGPAHVNGCPAFPLPTDPLACDATYDLSNLGSYGVQYWLTSNWATGFLNVGLGCSSTSVAQANASWTASEANGYRSRFVTNTPPMVSISSPYGGPCL